MMDASCSDLGWNRGSRRNRGGNTWPYWGQALRNKARLVGEVAAQTNRPLPPVLVRSVVKPMIDSVDRFGLKARHLRKHKQSVNRFYAVLSRRDYQTEIAAGYKKRFERNCGKLFTFLDHDGVPWNNNNAEHAIKAFARLRRSIGGRSSAKSIRDYLVLLSISETCRCKGVNFLRFVQFGQSDVDSFAGGSSKPPHPSRIELLEQSA